MKTNLNITIKTKLSGRFIVPNVIKTCKIERRRSYGQKIENTSHTDNNLINNIKSDNEIIYIFHWESRLMN